MSNRVESSELVVGRVYCDDSKDRGDSVYLRFVKFDEDGDPLFKWIRGAGSYSTTDNGLIPFFKSEIFYTTPESDRLTLEELIG
jgi:hypothetical protein